MILIFICYFYWICEGFIYHRVIVISCNVLVFVRNLTEQSRLEAQNSGVGTDKKQKNKSIFNISSLLMDINSVTSGDEIMNKEWRTLIDNADRVCGNHA
jgi:hypothetical protein